MALRFISLNAAGDAAETLNNVATLSAAVTTAIDAAGTANAVAGSNADVTTELAAITTALAALTANIPSNAIVLTLDTSSVTSKNALRRVLDKVYAHVAASNLLT